MPELSTCSSGQSCCATRCTLGLEDVNQQAEVGCRSGHDNGQKTDPCCGASGECDPWTTTHAAQKPGHGCCGSSSAAKAWSSSPSRDSCSRDACTDLCRDDSQSHKPEGLGDAPVEDLCTSSCCRKGGTSPRCDQDCIKAYAAYDCATYSGKDHVHGQSTGEPCNRHLEAAFERYGTLLEKAQCLCRSVLSSPIVRCCAKKAVRSGTTRSGSSDKGNTDVQVLRATGSTMGTAVDQHRKTRMMKGEEACQRECC